MRNVDAPRPSFIAGVPWLWTLCALSACATVPPGHLGVLLRPSGVSPEPLGEGVHVTGPFACVDVYDLRAEQHTEDLVGVSADGARLEARASVLTFHQAPGELVPLAREVGPDYYRMVVEPIVGSTVRGVLAGCRADELGTPGILRAQAEITRVAAERLRPFHIVVDSINIRTLALASSPLTYRAIVDTAVLEQQTLSIPNVLALARKRADGWRTAARGIAASYAILSPTLNPGTLGEASVRAWNQLLTAPSTEVDVLEDRQHDLVEVTP